MSSPTDPPSPPPQEDSATTTAGAIKAAAEKNPILKEQGPATAKPGADQLAAFTQGAQEIKVAAAQAIAETTDSQVSSSKVTTFWIEAQREKQGELDLEKTRLLNQSFSEDIAARRVYARQIFALIIAWLSAIFLVLLLQGFSSKTATLFLFHSLGSQWKMGSFQLSEPVLLALIGGTTASVLGLFAIVAKYFFPEKNKQP